MSAIDKMSTDGTFENISKRERLSIARQRAKLQQQFGSIAELTRLPAALFVVDIMKEHIPIAEARRLNIPTFAIVDTNSDPNHVDFPIPANDDASSSIELIAEVITRAVAEGLTERKEEREKEIAEEKEHAESEEKAAKKMELIEKEDEIEKEAIGQKAKKEIRKFPSRKPAKAE
jgi:small subunit ribosomal protein S2